VYCELTELNAVADNHCRKVYMPFYAMPVLVRPQCAGALRQYLETRVDGSVKRWHGSKAAAGSLNTSSSVGTSTSKSRPGSGNRLAFEDELFIVLVKLKTGRLNHDLAFQFGVSVGLISEIFTSWLCFLCTELKLLFEMTDCGKPVNGVPVVYQNYSGLRIVIDCTELMLQKCY